MGALGDFWDIGIDMNSIPFNLEKVLGVWRYLLGADGFAGLFWPDTAVFTRVGNNAAHGIGIDLSAEYYQILHG